MVEEIEYFKSKYKNVLVIGVYVPEALCYSRTLERAGREKFPTLKEFFFRRECEDYALGLGSIYSKLLDFTIDNDTNNMNLLKDKVDKVLVAAEHRTNIKKVTC